MGDTYITLLILSTGIRQVFGSCRKVSLTDSNGVSGERDTLHIPMILLKRIPKAYIRCNTSVNTPWDKK